MKEEIKIIAGISAKSSLKWLSVMLTGNLFTLICFFVILFQNVHFAGGGHGNLYAFITGLFFSNICGFILFAGAPVFGALYFVLANKTAAQYMLHLTWKNKVFSSYIDSKVVFLVDKLTSSNNWAGKASNAAMFRLQLLEANRNDKENSKIKKRIIGYVFKKINLDDIDFSNPDLKLSEIVSIKLNNFISDAVKPSSLFFWLLFLLQLGLLIASQFLN
ncbi:hypothetical protein [Flavobacterium gelatinilyticum]|uniref:hypothetical protein n=1 Tax=Flavobacterium gelatinilyticum TaxID=3003260 RepID=UPI0024812DEF|nr:hypothetical protein [Flavobacterium gelatinilyticum]